MRKKKQFCIHGHNFSITGRDSKGKCKACKKERAIKRRKRIKDGLHIVIPKVQFCPKGHDTFVCGRTIDSACKECAKLVSANWLQTHREEEAMRKKKWVEDHPAYGPTWNAAHKVEIHEYNQEYSRKNRETLLAQKKQYYQDHKEELDAKNEAWEKAHPELVRAYKFKCSTNRQLRIVAWTDWDNIFEFDRNKPKDMTLDHYIPLQGDEVSGLHVSWNLQYLTFSENSRKNNTIDLNDASEWYGKILEEAGLK